MPNINFIEEPNLCTCDNCNEQFDPDEVTFHDIYRSGSIIETVCENCIDNCCDDYEWDSYQEQYIEGDNARWVEDDEAMIEDNEYIMHRHDLHECDYCHNIFNDSNMLIDDDMAVCQRCADRRCIKTCYNCGRILPGSDQYWFDNFCYCEDCCPDNEIEDYGHTTSSNCNLEFYSMPGEETKEYLGVELEVDRGDEEDRNECARDVKEAAGFALYCKRDGSLGDSGFEIVSSPATLRYHLENGNWNKIQDICRNHGFRSHDTDTCGLHVHVSRNFFGESADEQDVHIAILMMLECRFKEQFHTFARRYSEQWCKDNIISITANDTFEDVKNKSDKFKHDRYYQINVCNRDTVEFRCFRGTLRYETLVATLQFVATLSRYCQQITIADVDSVEWEDIFYNTEYKELREYMQSKNLL